ncbi:hypothetical protein GQ457_07G006980 [Hibiscus cannabinus]
MHNDRFLVEFHEGLKSVIDLHFANRALFVTIHQTIFSITKEALRQLHNDARFTDCEMKQVLTIELSTEVECSDSLLEPPLVQGVVLDLPMVAGEVGSRESKVFDKINVHSDEVKDDQNSGIELRTLELYIAESIHEEELSISKIICSEVDESKEFQLPFKVNADHFRPNAKTSSQAAISMYNVLVVKKDVSYTGGIIGYFVAIKGLAQLYLRCGNLEEEEKQLLQVASNVKACIPFGSMEVITEGTINTKASRFLVQRMVERTLNFSLCFKEQCGRDVKWREANQQADWIIRMSIGNHKVSSLSHEQEVIDKDSMGQLNEVEFTLQGILQSQLKTTMITWVSDIVLAGYLLNLEKEKKFIVNLVEILSGEAKVVDVELGSQVSTIIEAMSQSIDKPPYFNSAHYSHWMNRMMILLQSIDYMLWDVIEDGLTIPMKRVGETQVPKERHEWSNQERKQMQLNVKAMHISMCSRPNCELENLIDTIRELENLISCSAVLADEWTAPTAKHRRSSSEFDLAKGDGWLKEFEGWRFKVNNGGYYTDASTAICVIGENNLFLMGVLLNQLGMVDLAMICYFKLCFQCSYLGVDFVQCGRVFTENILVVYSMICIKVMSCSITAEISLSTRLEILRVSEVLGGIVGVDFGIGKQFRSSGILHPALCTPFFPSLVFLYEGIYKALIDFGGINRATPFMFGLITWYCNRKSSWCKMISGRVARSGSDVSLPPPHSDKAKQKLHQNMISSLLASSIAKAKSMAAKGKLNAAKARLIMLTLLKSKKAVFLGSISNKIHGLLGDKESNQVQEQVQEQNKAIVPYSYDLASNYGDDEEKYPDLTHSLFDEELELVAETETEGVSIVEMVRRSREEGEEFRLEDEIDHVADLFITRFYKQMRLQKLLSFKRYQEMMERSL